MSFKEKLHIENEMAFLALIGGTDMCVLLKKSEPVNRRPISMQLLTKLLSIVLSQECSFI